MLPFFRCWLRLIKLGDGNHKQNYGVNKDDKEEDDNVDDIIYN